MEQGQQGPGVNAGGGGGDAERVRSLQDLRAPSFLGSQSVRRKISLNRGLRPMKEAAWSRASRVQVSMQEVEGGTLST